MDFESRLLRLARQGFECAQILMILALDIEGASNPELIRAMSGLNGGMGRSGGACGVMTGGACVLGYFAGKGEAEEPEHSCAREIVAEYTQWFKSRFCGDCRDIIGGDFSKCLVTCAPIMRDGFEKILELLEKYEILEV